MQRRISRAWRGIAVGLALVAMACVSAAAPAPMAVNPYDAIVDAVVRHYDLPGIAVGVIKDGKVVYRATRGERVVGSGPAIDDDTLFKIASNSKAMTAAVLGRLVEQGKLQWTTPVRDILPAFAMHDPWVSAHMNVADLLVHHSGLPEGGGDLMLWPTPNDFTRADIIAGLKYLRPAYEFRAGYAYDNLLYVVAGEVAVKAGGAPYADLVRRELFRRLGMTRCQVGTWSRDAVGNVAQPHQRHAGRNVVFQTDGATITPTTMEAAGGIRCSLNDMLTWAMNWLAPTTQQLAWLPAAERERAWTPWTPMPISARQRAWDATRVNGYGYGWRIVDVDGELTYGHTGTLAGMYSAMRLLPERKSGFVVLINANADAARTVLIEALTKTFTARDQARPVTALMAELDAAARQRHATRVPDTSARVAATTRELAPHLGTWRDPWFGEVTICAVSGGVRFAAAKSPRLAGAVMRVGNRWLVAFEHGDAEAWLEFPTQAGGTLKMAKVDPDADFSYDYEDLAFTRTHDCPPPAAKVTLSPATTAAAANLVDIRTLVPDIALDVKYAGADNFMGRPAAGYQAATCLLLAPVAAQLAKVERALREDELRLRIWDCYRPARAVADFVAWAHDADDDTMRASHYPDLDKSELLGEYIAPVSGHSRGGTVDLTLQHCPKNGAACQALDMGTDFDWFGPRAHTDAPGITQQQRANRERLLQAMAAAGFKNYPLEWWHYTLDPEPSPRVMFDVVIQ